MNSFADAMFNLSVFCVVCFALYYLFIFFQMFISLFLSGKKKTGDYVLSSLKNVSDDNMIPVSVIIPLQKTEKSAIESILHIMQSEYPNIEYIVINSGASELVHNEVLSHFKLDKIECSIKASIKTSKIKNVYYNADFPNLLYIDKIGTNFCDAVNCGINISKFPLYTVLQPGFIIEKNSVFKLASVFLKDSSTIVSAGLIRPDKILSSSSNSTYYFETLECIKASFHDKASPFYYGTLFSDAGIFGIFNKQTVIDCGGYQVNAIDYNHNLLMKMESFLVKNNRRYSFKQSSNVVCQVPAASSFGSLLSRYKRWQKGICTTLKKFFVSSIFGKFSLKKFISYLYLFFFEFLYVFINVFSYISLIAATVLGKISIQVFLLLIAGLILSEIIISLFALTLNQRSNDQSLKISRKIVGTVLLENFGKKQLTMFSRFLGIFKSKNKFNA